MKKIIIAALAIVAMVGCTTDNTEISVTPSDGALSFSTSIATRADKDAWAQNDAIGVCMTITDFGDHSANVEYTTSGDGIFTSDNPIYFPAISPTVSVFAYYPYVEDEDDYTIAIDSKDQVDVLVATKSEVSLADGYIIDLVLEHMFSKVQFTLKAGEDLDDADFEDVSVKLEGLSTTANYLILDDDIKDLGDKSELALDISDDNLVASAVVIPQTLGENLTLYITLEDYGVFAASLSTSAFEQGTQYSYTVTVNRDNIEVSEANIESWNKNDLDSSFADGSDIYLKSDGTYYIYTANGLAAFRDLVNGSPSSTTSLISNVTFTEEVQNDIDGKLMNDIDLSDICKYVTGTTDEDISWTPIGNYTMDDNDHIYAGTFDGGGHKVSGLYINSTSSDQGLFGYVRGGTIKNLGVSGKVTSSSCYIGGIVGRIPSFTGDPASSIENCYNTGAVKGAYEVGGIAGSASYSATTIENCYNTGDITGTGSSSNSYVGGIAGIAYSIENCYNTGAVNSSTHLVGGITGGGAKDITNCYNSGAVKGAYEVGGIAGTLSSMCYVINCYNSGAVEGEYKVGGVMGATSYGKLILCYSSGSVNATTDVSYGGVVGYTSSATISYCYYDTQTVEAAIPTKTPTTAIGPEDGTGMADFSDVRGISTAQMQSTDLLQEFNNQASSLLSTYDLCAWVQKTEGASYLTLDFDSTPVAADVVDIALSGDTYNIYTANGLAAFRDLVNGSGNTTFAITSDDISFTTIAQSGINGKLMNDIDLSSLCGDGQNGTANASWSPIGFTVKNESDPANIVWDVYGYAGTLDGDGHEIKNLYINSANQLGLFSYVDAVGKVYNLGVSGNVTGGDSSWQIGGIVANNYGFIINCYSLVNVKGGTNIGGIAGYNYDGGKVVNCYNRGSVTGMVNNVGGIVGTNDDAAYVGYCYSVGEVDLDDAVTSSRKIGGVVGWNHLVNNDDPQVKGSFCLNNTDYSIGQVEYVTASGITGNVCTDDYLLSDVFATIMNNGAYTYDSVYSPTLKPCAWIDNSGNSTPDYPTLDFGEAPEYSWIYDIIYISASSTYQIYSGLGLQAFAALVNDEDNFPAGVVTSGGDAYFKNIIGTPQPNITGKLMNDIDLSSVCGSSDDETTADVNWTPIGNSTYQFKGTFNGNGKVVENLYIDTESDNQGLFGCVDGSSAEVKNLGVSGSVTGNDYVGGVVGYSSSSSVTSCYNTATVTATKSDGTRVGGVVGYSSSSSSVTSCYNSGAVTAKGGSSHVGGVVGYFSSTSSVTLCYNSGAVTAESAGASVGGVVGYSSSSSVISWCYNSGAVTAKGTSSYVGGVVGFSQSKPVISCYSYGSVSSASNDSNRGGVVGKNNSGQVRYSFYDTSTVDNGDGLETTYTPTGAVANSNNTSYNYGGLTTEYMRGDATTTGSLLYYFSLIASDDSFSSYSGHWQADATQNINSGYPILSWQSNND